MSYSPSVADFSKLLKELGFTEVCALKNKECALYVYQHRLPDVLVGVKESMLFNLGGEVAGIEVAANIKNGSHLKDAFLYAGGFRPFKGDPVYEARLTKNGHEGLAKLHSLVSEVMSFSDLPIESDDNVLWWDSKMLSLEEIARCQSRVDSYCR